MNELINLDHNPQKFLEAQGVSDSPWVTLTLLSLAAVILIISGIKNKASLGIVLTAALIFIAARLGLISFVAIGFIQQKQLYQGG